MDTYLHKMKDTMLTRWHIWRNRHLKNRDVTIISNNCIAGVIYHDCGMRFLSPTINLWLSAEDFFTYAAHIRHYCPQYGANLTEIKEGGVAYPVGRLTPLPTTNLPALTIYFQHYSSFSSAKEKWEERSRRINLENICMIFESSQDIPADSPIYELLQNAPYTHKVLVTSKNSAATTEDLPVVHLPIYSKPNYFPGKIFATKTKLSLSRWLDDFDYVTFLNASQGTLTYEYNE